MEKQDWFFDENGDLNWEELLMRMDSNGNVPGLPTREEIRFEYERRICEGEGLDDAAEKYFRSEADDARSRREEAAGQNVERYLRYQYENN